MKKLLLATVLTITMLHCNDNPKPTTQPAPVLPPAVQNQPKIDPPNTKQLADICTKVKCSKIGNACVPDGAYAMVATVYKDDKCTQYAAWVQGVNGCYAATAPYAVLMDDHDPTCGAKPGALAKLGAKLDLGGKFWYIDGDTGICTVTPAALDFGVYDVDFTTITRFDDITCN